MGSLRQFARMIERAGSTDEAALWPSGADPESGAEPLPPEAAPTIILEEGAAAPQPL
jgi:hypothetical protein